MESTTIVRRRGGATPFPGPHRPARSALPRDRKQLQSAGAVEDRGAPSAGIGGVGGGTPPTGPEEEW